MDKLEKRRARNRENSRRYYAAIRREAAERETKKQTA
jgi:hypothetical protein